jgi:GntR family transcriptional regulator
VVHLIHSAYGETGEILEVSESIWPADRIVILDDYDLAQDAEDL